MKLHFKFDLNLVCKKILNDQLSHLNLGHEVLGLGEVEVMKNPSTEQLATLSNNLKDYGIELVENKKSILVQRVKDVVTEMIYTESDLPNIKISAFIAEKLDLSYGYIANIFSEVTYTSIESFIILQKIERSKQLISIENLNFTEISFRLNYSSVAHFCNQFKNVTGLTPTAFQRIVNKKRETVQKIV